MDHFNYPIVVIKYVLAFSPKFHVTFLKTRLTYLPFFVLNHLIIFIFISISFNNLNDIYVNFIYFLLLYNFIIYLLIILFILVIFFFQLLFSLIMILIIHIFDLIHSLELLKYVRIF